MTKNDTIVAVSTPAGVGGIAVVRASGADALPFALKHLAVPALKARRATSALCRSSICSSGSLPSQYLCISSFIISHRKITQKSKK